MLRRCPSSARDAESRRKHDKVFFCKRSESLLWRGRLHHGGQQRVSTGWPRTNLRGFPGFGLTVARGKFPATVSETTDESTDAAPQLQELEEHAAGPIYFGETRTWHHRFLCTTLDGPVGIQAGPRSLATITDDYSGRRYEHPGATQALGAGAGYRMPAISN